MAAHGIAVRARRRGREPSPPRGPSHGLVATLTTGSGPPGRILALMEAIGRYPATRRASGSQAAGVVLDARGRRRRRQSGAGPARPRYIYAVGDVTGWIALTPLAIREGHAVADTLFGGRPTPGSTTTASRPRSSPRPRSARSACPSTWRASAIRSLTSSRPASGP